MYRTGELGDLPQEIAAIAKRILREEAFQEIVQFVPWLQDEGVNSVQWVLKTSVTDKL
ncbi:MAG: hypothetical protein MH186_12860 [Marinobacter sp.]|nr:hypothetical protein [Marinobacter sp.]